MTVGVIGAGLAGSDCAWALAQNGIPVKLFEKKRVAKNPAQTLTDFAELVCTNSLKSLDPESAHGLLKVEMKALGSLILKLAHEHAVPAGAALAVDRQAFSAGVTKALSEHPLIEVIDREVTNPEELRAAFDLSQVVVATGPLTSEPLEQWIASVVGASSCYFYDAIAPIVDADTLDYSKLYFKNRWEDPSAEADYLNAPLNREQYELLIAELVAAKKVPPKDFERATFFESCLPIDVMAERGTETARFSCMKPVGLFEGSPVGKPYAVVQLRKENLQGSAFNLVGFQTRLTHSEQVRVFRLIPGFEQAQFFHLGSVHRNTYLNSAQLLNSSLALKQKPWLHFAGQITGVEGYTESAACGLYVAHQIIAQRRAGHLDGPALPVPSETALGALIHYILHWEKPVPSNINFGLFPPVILPELHPRSGRKQLRRELLLARARECFESYFTQITQNS